MKPARRCLCLILALVVAACSAEETARPGRSVRRVATIQYDRGSVSLAVPATARVGEPIPVVVTTYGDGCHREDSTEVHVTGLRAEVVPYQRVYTPRADEGCALALHVNPRLVRVVFRAAGRATVRVTGRAELGDSLLRVERGLTVR